MVMINFNFFKIPRILTALAVLSSIVPYANAIGPSNDDNIEDYTKLSVEELLTAEQLPQGIVRIKGPGTITQIFIDRTNPLYHKLALELHGHVDKFPTANVQTIVTIENNGKKCVAYLDKYDPGKDIGSPSCSVIKDYVFVEGNENQGTFVFKLTPTGMLTHRVRLEMLGIVRAAACGGFIDPASSTYPEGSSLTPHDPETDIIDLSLIAGIPGTLSCGNEFYNFPITQNKIFVSEDEEARTTVLALTNNTKINFQAVCKQVYGEQPKLLDENDPEFLSSVVKFLPYCIHPNRLNKLPVGAALQKLDEKIQIVRLDRYVLRLAHLVLPGGTVVDIDDTKTNAIWIIQEDDTHEGATGGEELGMNIIMGHENYYDDIDPAFHRGFVVHPNGVEEVTNNFLAPNMRTSTATLYQYYGKRNPLRDFFPKTAAELLSPMAPLYKGSYKGPIKSS